jgi:hypothetical protein
VAYFCVFVKQLERTPCEVVACHEDPWPHFFVPSEIFVATLTESVPAAVFLRRRYVFPSSLITLSQPAGRHAGAKISFSIDIIP